MELPLLDEPAEHLRLHEDLQEAPHSLGGGCLPEPLALEGAGARGGGRGGVAVLTFTKEEEWIVAHELHEEAHKGLGHGGAEMIGVYGEKYDSSAEEFLVKRLYR